MENLIIKLKKLKEIRPDPGYCQYSKLLIRLKALKEIEPNLEYCRSSKLAIFGASIKIPTVQFNPILNWRLALTLASLFLVLITGGLYNYLYLEPSVYNYNLNALTLETDLKNMNINIQLAKIEYYQESQKTISLALKEIGENQINHLNSLILESEKNQLKEESSANEDIKNLLDQLIL